MLIVFSRCIKSIAPTVAVALGATNITGKESLLGLTSSGRGFKVKTRSGCQKSSPKSKGVVALDSQNRPAFAFRRQTRSYKFGRSTSNVQFWTKFIVSEFQCNNVYFTNNVIFFWTMLFLTWWTLPSHMWSSGNNPRMRMLHMWSKFH